jgi:integrase
MNSYKDKSLLTREAFLVPKVPVILLPFLSSEGIMPRKHTIKVRGLWEREHEAELTISLGTGMRLSEQYTLAWKNIDFERREINLDRTKNGSPRMIPMNDAVMGANVSQ